MFPRSTGLGLALLLGGRDLVYGLDSRDSTDAGSEPIKRVRTTRIRRSPPTVPRERHREADLEIFFASERDGDSHDIYTAIRTNKNDPFGGVKKLTVLSTPSPGIDWPLWLSPDLCTLYYINKDSDAPTATARLYVTSRR